MQSETEYAIVDFMKMPVKVLPHMRDALEMIYRDLARIPTSVDKSLHRILSLGDESGHFATFCAKRWPRAWVDLPVAKLSDIQIWENVPPGCKVIELAGEKLELGAYDLIRIGIVEWLPVARACSGWKFIGNSLVRWKAS